MDDTNGKPFRTFRLLKRTAGVLVAKDGHAALPIQVTGHRQDGLDVTEREPPGCSPKAEPKKRSPFMNRVTLKDVALQGREVNPADPKQCEACISYERNRFYRQS
jgi:hypothetical protein